MHFAKSEPLQIMPPIAPSAHFVPLTSFVLVVGDIAFFNGKASVSLGFGPNNPIVRNCSFGKL